FGCMRGRPNISARDPKRRPWKIVQDLNGKPIHGGKFTKDETKVNVSFLQITFFKPIFILPAP
ncbi:MAG: hypothetical protein ACKPAC_13960, partial [Alphaproteobacteria bacterium]